MSGNEILDPSKLVKKIRRIYIRANTKWYGGKADDALEHIQQGEKLLKDFPGVLSKEMIQYNCRLLQLKVAISVFIGNLSLSFKCANDILKIAEEVNDKVSLSCAMQAFGMYYWISGDLDQALKYFDQFIEIGQDFAINTVDVAWLAAGLQDAVSVAVAKGNLERAKEYFDQLEKLYEQKEYQKLFHQYYLSAKARLLKSSTRFRDRVLAEDILKEILENEQIHASIKFLSLIDLCELLLNELCMTNDINIVNEIKFLINKIEHIAQNINSNFYLIEAFVLQGKIALITFEIKEARRFLIQAQKIAERNGYKKLALEISNLHEEMIEQLEIWDYLKEINAPVSRRMELAHLSEDINNIIRSRIANTTYVSDKRVSVYKERKMCLVCKGAIEGFNNYICPKCDSIYCEKCAQALIELENMCWSCELPIDKSKPVKPYKEEEKVDIEISEKPQKKPKIDKKPSNK